MCILCIQIFQQKLFFIHIIIAFIIGSLRFRRQITFIHRLLRARRNIRDFAIDRRRHRLDIDKRDIATNLRRMHHRRAHRGPGTAMTLQQWCAIHMPIQCHRRCHISGDNFLLLLRRRWHILNRLQSKRTRRTRFESRHTQPIVTVKRRVHAGLHMRVRRRRWRLIRRHLRRKQIIHHETIGRGLLLLLLMRLLLWWCTILTVSQHAFQCR
mmetsp:Transcript_27400/g.45062  ORF Transcript_27400/g.45062 Transcript_27400/m.45062 type:complete len:211 (-) Transcript_27400:772-1404(-)